MTQTFGGLGYENAYEQSCCWQYEKCVVVAAVVVVAAAPGSADLTSSSTLNKLMGRFRV